jgi:hypothetical protein
MDPIVVARWDPSTGYPCQLTRQNIVNEVGIC